MTVMTCFCLISTVLQVLKVGQRVDQIKPGQTVFCALSGYPALHRLPKVTFLQRGFSRAHKHGAPQSVDRMALYTPGYTGIKQGLLQQVPHRIPNTMEPRTSGLSVTSFLEGMLFL